MAVSPASVAAGSPAPAPVPAPTLAPSAGSAAVMAFATGPAPAPLSATARHARRLLWASLLMLLLFFLWAFFGPLGIVSVAIGEVIPTSRVKSVQHLEGGIVAAILVTEGEPVQRGQPLMRLDPVRIQAELEELTSRLASLRVETLRLRAEAEGHPELSLPEDIQAATPALAENALALFAARQRRFQHEQAIYQTLIRQRTAEIQEITVRQAGNRRTLELITQQLSISENLLKNSLINRMQFLDTARQQQMLQSQVAVDEAALPRVRAALQEAQERAETIAQTFREEATRDLARVRQEYDELFQRLGKYQQAQERTVLRAPVDGIIKSIAVATEGAVIQPGQTVVELVPVDDRLVVEAKLPIQDVGYVRPGQGARITLDSPEALNFGAIDGTVETVSPDATVDAASGQAFYRIRIALAATRFESGNHGYQLYPGMRVVCGIAIGNRTVLDYLLGPWLRNQRYAFQER